MEQREGEAPVSEAPPDDPDDPLPNSEGAPDRSDRDMPATSTLTQFKQISARTEKRGKKNHCNSLRL